VRLVRLQRLRIAVDQQSQIQRTNAQHVLSHLAYRNDARQPIAVYLLLLLAHAVHLQQAKMPSATTSNHEAPTSALSAQ
jgi:hypothetical protein